MVSKIGSAIWPSNSVERLESLFLTAKDSTSWDWFRDFASGFKRWIRRSFPRISSTRRMGNGCPAGRHGRPGRNRDARARRRSVRNQMVNPKPAARTAGRTPRRKCTSHWRDWPWISVFSEIPPGLTRHGRSGGMAWMNTPPTIGSSAEADAGQGFRHGRCLDERNESSDDPSFIPRGWGPCPDPEKG